jgi:hypothetical protein
MSRITEGPPIIHGPYDAAKVNGRPAAALLSNGGRRMLAPAMPEDVAALLARRLNERDAYHRALTTIAEAGAFDPEAFARAVLDGVPHEAALADDHALIAGHQHAFVRVARMRGAHARRHPRHAPGELTVDHGAEQAVEAPCGQAAHLGLGRVGRPESGQDREEARRAVQHEARTVRVLRAGTGQGRPRVGKIAHAVPVQSNR